MRQETVEHCCQANVESYQQDEHLAILAPLLENENIE